IVLNSTDWGVIDITGAARTGGTTPTGVVKFWGIVAPIGMIPHGASNDMGYFENLLTSALSCRRLGAGAQLGIFINDSAAKSVTGSISFIGDG
ncbi:MAG: hypothetical protein K2X91_00450, partial [Thermoleophilia bacterium]|nr:hypothetical protein [Thermoleophilia bacterium]